MRLTVSQQHQQRVAIHTLKLSDAGARVMGGMTKEEARRFLRETCRWTQTQIQKLEGWEGKL